MSNFMEQLSKTQAINSRSVTDNGATGHSTTGQALLDMNFKISSYRNLSVMEAQSDFLCAFAENELLAIKWLFYVRDIRGGAGERDLFRNILGALVQTNPDIVKSIIKLIPEYGRFDDLLCLLRSNVRSEVLQIVTEQFKKDKFNMGKKEQISLLAKWMPALTATSSQARADAEIIRKHFRVTPRQYRKDLSKLRAYLRIVERDMSANRWGDIDYERVPSKANVLYNKAFFKHDPIGREIYIEQVNSGEKKINSSTNFPHDITSRYTGGVDMTLEALWKALPNYTDGFESTIVVADGSGSMEDTIGRTSTTALDVANALAIYFAERCTGEYKNKYITFSQTPQLVNLGNGTLHSKLRIANQYNEVANTNVEAVFQLILDTAVRNGLKQSDVPSTVLILSDMEFDQATTTYGYDYTYGHRHIVTKADSTLFEKIADSFKAHGYKLPKLAFWNIMSDSNTIPMVENENGVALISGFSPSAIKTAISGKYDPYEALVETLMSERYDLVNESMMNYCRTK